MIGGSKSDASLLTGTHVSPAPGMRNLDCVVFCSLPCEYSTVIVLVPARPVDEHGLVSEIVLSCMSLCACGSAAAWAPVTRAWAGV